MFEALLFVYRKLMEIEYIHVVKTKHMPNTKSLCACTQTLVQPFK